MNNAGYDSVRESFVGDRLRVARELRRLTQTELARLMRTADMGGGVSAAAVSQFETGRAVPSPRTIATLLAVLDVEPPFLTQAAADAEQELPGFFRSLRTTPAKERRRARNLAQLVHRLAVVVARHVDLVSRAIPAVPCDPFADPDDRRVQAEHAASEVRRSWRRDPGPVREVVGTIERHGVICARLRFDEQRVDAFSVPFSDYPVVVLAADKDKWDRSRFDAAHELGHIVMHGETAGVPEAERQANEFAAAFLMPADDIRHELPSRADWHQLLSLKDVWGTSLASLLYRARTLGVMPERTYVAATKVMAARGWRRHEPLNRPVESPRLLRDAIDRASASGVTLADLRSEAIIPPDLFDEVCTVITP